MKNLSRRFICIIVLVIMFSVVVLNVSASELNVSAFELRGSKLCAYCWTELRVNRTYQRTDTVRKSCENTASTGYVHNHYITYNCTEYVCTTQGCDFVYVSETFVRELCQVGNFKAKKE